jgi:hypothetical protein
MSLSSAMRRQRGFIIDPFRFGGGGVAHRYWRLVNVDTASVSGNFDISEVQLFDGASQQTVTTTTCSNVPTGGSLANLTNGNLTNGAAWNYATVESFGFFLMFDMGSAVTVDGIKIGSMAISGNFPITADMQYSDDGIKWFWAGYFTTGAYPGANTLTATYNFTARPAEPVMSSGTLVMELLMEGADNSTTFTDTGPDVLTVTPTGNAKINTSSSAIDTSWATLDGTGDQLNVTISPAINIRTDTYTWSAWVRVNGGNPAVLTGDASGGTTGDGVYFTFFGGTFYVGDNATNIAVSFTPAIGVLNHYAYSFDGTTHRVFFNGRPVLTSTTLLTSRAINAWHWGNRPSQGWGVNGNMDNARLIRGEAVYTSQFFPRPT